MADLDIEKFDPSVAEIQKIVEESKMVDITDLKQVKDKRITLKNIRVTITKKGKELREDAITFQKAVIAKEKELVGMIEPEEDRLQGVEDKAAEAAEMEKRKMFLPERYTKLSEIKDGIEVTDEELLAMDQTQFMEYVNKRRADKIEVDSKDLLARENKIKEEEQKQHREKETREREEKARREERERLDREAKEKVEREAREKKEEEERKEAERKELEAKAAFRAYVKEIGFETGNSEYYSREADGFVYFYKKIGEFKK